MRGSATLVRHVREREESGGIRVLYGDPRGCACPDSDR